MVTAMEPRALWERHTVLATAFCNSDEDVRAAQTTLDDAQASRARSLAAFAVVVGNDKAVAEMLGLPEREVRIARRTVGREDARSLADDLLLPTPSSAPSTGSQTEGAARTQEQPQVHDQQAAQLGETSMRGHTTEHSHVPDAAGWSPVQDAVLIDGWQAGVDMEILAVELGTDLPRLISRAQYLSAQGRLFATGDEAGTRQGGKHRREVGHTMSGSGAATVMPGPAPAGMPGIPGQQAHSPADMLLPDGLVPDGLGGWWANWNEMLPAQ